MSIEPLIDEPGPGPPPRAVAPCSAAMSAPKGTLNVERRGWDKDKYEQRAKDREEYGDEYVDGKGAEAEIRDRQ